jgi:thiol-disulfide isomerase/thioredoxin
MTDANGTIIELDSVRKKYTLIDFWASWCPPCRTESSLLNSLYSNYNSKGFEIYGIYLDSKSESWLKAIEKDQRIWPNVSSVEGFKTPISIEFGITALPTNFLIDETGKIIASNIHGKQLKTKIETLFN